MQTVLTTNVNQEIIPEDGTVPKTTLFETDSKRQDEGFI
jgi:hypothetical protein